MDIKFYSGFYKKENSTKQPDISNPTRTLTGYLIEPCSLMNPVFKIERFASDASPSSFTYAYIMEFNRFYFVKDWVWNNGLWQCMLSVDVLASFKSQLATKQEYILRTDTTNNPLDFNEYVTDTFYPATNDYTVNCQISEASQLLSDINDGMYIVGVVSGNTTDNVGSISYYAMTSFQFGRLNQMLFSDSNLQAMDIIDNVGNLLEQDVSKQVLKTMYNPFQYITSVMYFPFTNAIVSGTQVNLIKIGWWDYNLSGLLLGAQVARNIEESSFEITAHPQASTRGKYLNYAPYSKRTLMGRFGTVAIDSSCFVPGDRLRIMYDVDLITGHCLARIEYWNGLLDQYSVSKLITQREFIVGVPIQISQVGVDYIGATISALNGVTGAVTSAMTGNFSGAISNVTNGIYNTLSSSMPQLETSGTNGAFLTIFNKTKLLNVFYKIVDEDNEHIGRPVCGKRTLSTLTGYVLCAEGDLDLDCFDSERISVKKFLTSGFFWE